MQRGSVTVDEAITLLNEAVQRDPDAIETLLESHVPCNALLAQHPTIQCWLVDRKPRVGLLGILNGLFGVDEYRYGPIMSVHDGAGRLLRFARTAEVWQDVADRRDSETAPPV